MKIVGNLPYNISTPAAVPLAEYGNQVTDMHFMLQKVVDRMVARAGHRRLRPAVGDAAIPFSMERILDVPPESFNLPPRWIPPWCA